MVPGAGLEPARFSVRDFNSLYSLNYYDVVAKSIKQGDSLFILFNSNNDNDLIQR